MADKLVMGRTGAAVAALQAKLRELGHEIAEGELKAKRFGKTTRAAVERWQSDHGVEPTGEIGDVADLDPQKGPDDASKPGADRDEPGQAEPDRGKSPDTGTPPPEFAFLVRGQVLYRDGLPIPGLEVRAFHKELRREIDLGRTTTDDSGNYEIYYSIDHLEDSKRRSPDLVVRVYEAGDAATKPVAESRVIFAAQRIEKVRLLVDGGAARVWSEFEQLADELSPLLGDLRPADLKQDADQQDITLLAGKVNQDPERLAAFVIADKLHRKTGVPAEVFYALAREGHGSRLADLVLLDRSVRRRAIRVALDKHVAPGHLADQLDEVDEQLRRAAIEHLLDTPPATGEATLGSVLNTVVGPEVSRSFVEAYLEKTGSARDFWTELEANPEFSGRLEPIQLSLQLATLTGNHLPLVEALVAMHDAGELGSIREVARLTESDWRQIVDRLPEGQRYPASIADTSATDPAAVYAATLARIVRDSMPTAVIAHRAQADASSSADERAFWSNVTTGSIGFELGRGAIAPWLSQHPELVEGVGDIPALTDRLAVRERLFNLTRSYDEQKMLLDAGVDSSLRLAQLGRDVAVQRFASSLGPDRAAYMFDSAARVAGAALNLIATYDPSFNQTPIPVLPSPSGIPSVDTLFGTSSLCACAECRSIHSPAAYFAELLAFLADRPQTLHPVGGGTVATNARDILLARRPDLGEIELTCANTNTMLPYVDLVDEILERAIMPFAPFDLPVGVVSDLDGASLSGAIRAAFAANGFELTDHQVTVVTPGAHWFVTNHSTLYPISRTGGGAPRVLAESFQTSGNPDELTANPEHQTPAAYEALRGAFYPWILPLDLWWEETRTYLGHLGAPRSELMREFSPLSADAVLAHPAISAESIGLSAVERDLITGGRQVVAATTASLPSLAGALTVDGVAVASGDLVLVKDQASASDNGLYRVSAGTWTYAEPGTTLVLKIGGGGSNGGTTWLLRPSSPLVTVITRLGPWDAWGLLETANSITVFDPTHPETPATLSVGWLDALRWVRRMLRHAGIDYEELVDLLETSFINPSRSVRIESADPNDVATCDLAKLVLTNLDAATLGRIHRFVRLRRRLDWTTFELDRAITALGSSQPDLDLRLGADLLVRLGTVEHLRLALGASIDDVVSFWSPIQTAGTDSAYSRLFQNPVVTSPVDPAFALVAGELAILTADPTSATIALHAPTIRAGLGISAADLAALVSQALPDEVLNLQNLSTIHRQVVLARGLDLSIPESLTLQAMAGIDPFDPAHAENAELFVDLVGRVRGSGLGIADIDYLLFHRSAERSSLDPTEGAIAEVLADLRAGLRRIADETISSPDPAGDRTRRALATARWPAEAIDRVIVTLAGSSAYTAALAAMPLGFVVPPALVGRLTFDGSFGTLSITGPLAEAERLDLLAASTDPAYQAAIQAIFAAPRTFLANEMRAFVWPRVSVALPSLPAGVAFPVAFRNRIYHDPGQSQLWFDGYMTEADQSELVSLSSDPAYVGAIDALRNARLTVALDPENRFLSATDASAILDPVAAPVERFGTVLGRLLEYQRLSQSRRLIVRRLGEALPLDARLTEEVLTVQLPALSNPALTAMADFLAPAFAGSNPAVELTAAIFPNQFRTYLRIQKIALLVKKLRLTAVQMRWLVELGGTVPPRPIPWVHGAPLSVGWLGLGDLVAEPTPRVPARFAAWLRTVELAGLRAAIPGGEVTLDELLRSARSGSATATGLLSLLSKRTGWDEDELTALASADILGLSLPADLTDESGLTRIIPAMRRLRRLGVSALQVKSWTKTQPAASDADAVRRAAKAVYDDPQWLTVAKPLRDALRRKQRDALAAYLVSPRPGSSGEGFVDANDLYAHFLIDVEIDPCMGTSRLKQAIGSVQQFIQRCLMNLEPDVIADETADVGWNLWSWMKNYRVWEANRKIFLYPENWLVPELRDDKTPFFKSLETALLQGDITNDSAEDAFAAYLERLDEVARLEVAGTYHEPGVGGAPDILHVFGRTQGRPPVYFYRQWIGQARWSPWERVELDISEAQIVPVVWNRRLFLFWPVFTEHTDEVSPPPDKPVAPTRYFQIQLAWSEYKHGKWQPKRTTPDTLPIRSNIVPDVDLADHGRSKHVFRVAVEGAGLKVWYEYDNPATKFATPYGGSTVAGFATVKGFHFLGCDGKVRTFSTPITGIFEPTGTKVQGMEFVEDGSSPLNLPTGATSGTTESVALATTPGKFNILYAHQDGLLTGRRPFFFQDDDKTFFVVPRQSTVVDWIWIYPEHVDPIHIKVIETRYYKPDPIPDPIGPISVVFDPVPVYSLLAAGEAMTEGANGFGAGDLDASRPLVDASAAETIGGIERASAQATPTQVLLERRSRTFTEQKLVQRRSEAIDAYELPSVTVLSRADHDIIDIGTYIDDAHLFMPIGVPILRNVWRYEFEAFQHDYVCSFMQALSQHGPSGLLRRQTQLQVARPFEARYGPTALVERGDPVTKERYPVDDVDFGYGGAYSVYNWELFFQAPYLIASKLCQNQRYEDAQRWLHYVFDPTDTSSSPVPDRYWRTRPFFEQRAHLEQQIERIVTSLANGTADDATTRQVEEWLTNPFKPFVVARLRTTAFQKAVVMRYLDVLIGWGDQLFRRDTLETINEATQLYVLAAQILGRQDPEITPRAEPQVQTYNSLSPRFSALTNKLVEIEYLVASPRPDSVVTEPGHPPLPIPQLLYFCVPPNDRFASYWATVSDRLFKIRHCMNVEGVTRQLALFEPPIDPALLVKAAAAGIDITSALADQAAPLPAYRFSTLAQKATELCGQLQALGSALLGALETRDGEAVAMLRTQHETELLELTETVRLRHVDEASQQLVILRRSRAQAVARWVHYQRLLGVQSPVVPAEGATVADATSSANATIAQEEGIRMVERERTELERLRDSHDSQMAASEWEFGSSIAHTIPNFNISIKPWGVGTGVSFGGGNVGAALSAVANRFRSDGTASAFDATRAGRLGQLVLREHDWVLQANVAAREIMSIDQQILGASIGEEIAKIELSNHRTQVRNAQAIEDFLGGKYTNQELYDWRIGQIAAVYFQTYQLAYDLSKRCERAYRFELGLQDSNLIHFGHWDSLRKGLLAGERLHHDVKRMEVSYLELNRREFELTKHVSLASLHPAALIDLREAGSCYVELPEAIFDLDHPGHYMRRIRSVSLSLPCTTGPYTSVGCQLTLLSNRTRVDPRPTPSYVVSGEDKRFVRDSGGIQSIVTSTATNDPGLFSDDLGDPRFLPFEGTGAISSWRLELPAEFRQFDYRTIADAVLHVRYTARDGGAPLRKAAVDSLTAALHAMELEQGKTGLYRAFSLRTEFPDAWQHFIHKPAAEPGAQQFEVLLGADRFPAPFRDRSIKIDNVAIFVVPGPGVGYDASDPLSMTVHTPGDTEQRSLSFEAVETDLGGLPADAASFGPPGLTASATAPWTVSVDGFPSTMRVEIDVDGTTIQRLDPDAVRDVGLLVHYII